MAEDLINRVRNTLDGQIDFEGQRLADLLTTVLLVLVGTVSFIVGFISQDIYKSLFVGLAGTIVTFVVIVPPWPFFNRNPLPWLPASAATTGGMNIQVDKTD